MKDSQNVLTNNALIKDILVYEVGFLVCAAIGIIYIVVMPIVGLFLMCCRCCGNCGGKMYQKQTASIHCRRRTLYWGAFITTFIILAGNICMFRSNQAVKLSVDQSPVQLESTLDNLESFLTAVPQQLAYVFNQSYITIDKISENFNGIGPQLASEIEERLRKTLDPAVHTVRLMNQDVVNTSYQLKQLNSSLTQLQSSMDTLQANITAVKSHISQTLSSPKCMSCETLTPDLQSLTMTISFNIPSLNEFQSDIDKIMKADLESKIKEAENYFNRLPQLVTNTTEDTVQSINQELDKIKTQISQATGNFSLIALPGVSDTLDQARKKIVAFAPEAKKAERIRWIVCVVLCCVILLVVLCNLLGLVLGPLGLKPNANPTQRSSTANCGGTFLMMGAGFSFLVSWLFMLLVLFLFLLGGNTYSLLCKPWKNGELLKFIDDSPGLIPGLDSLNSTGMLSDLSIANIYSNCKKNMPLWSVLHLDRVVDLGNLLNVSQYTEKIQQQFENTEIIVPTVTLLSPEQQNRLSSFSTSAGNVDFTLIMLQINNISRTNFSITADKLDILAGVQTNDDSKTELSSAASDLRQIQAKLETTVIPQLESLTPIIESLQFTADRINGTVGGMLEKVKTAQDFLNTNTAQIVKAVSSQSHESEENVLHVVS
ncbi:prominin-2 [Thalassophryne amazonica]|uniref:prominin-2 n=1 Tax=Thalassophryne amazonica TaxID=390379 RepID=UPI0014716073|nr:prominin-2 [Thalassophryne amazonica]